METFATNAESGWALGLDTPGGVRIAQKMKSAKAPNGMTSGKETMDGKE